jgi:hypothetical protein
MKVGMKFFLLLLLVLVASISRVEAKVLAENLELATVYKGEGVEHAFIRQLESDPKGFGFPGEITNLDAIKEWTGVQAHRLAIKFGYVDPKFGGEVRVTTPDKVAFVIEKDKEGSLQCKEFVRNGSEESFPSSPERSIQTTGDSIAKFLAHEDNSGVFTTGVGYEYFQIPTEVLKDI